MPLYLCYCIDRPGTDALRNSVRPEHMAYLETRDELVLGGAKQSEEGESGGGSAFLVNVPDRAAALAFINGDPFTKADLFDSITVTRVRKGFWHPERAVDA
jgi:uncharacterized protein